MLTKPMNSVACIVMPPCFRRATPVMAMPLSPVALINQNLCKGVNLLCRTPVDSFEIMRLFSMLQRGNLSSETDSSHPFHDDVSLPYP